jgi:putative transposase
MPVVFEFKVKGKPCQYQAIDEAIRTGQFVRNKCIRLWMDVKGTNKYDLSAYCKVLAHEFPFANRLNSTARQAMSERAWASISRFYDNCRRKMPGKKGYSTKFKQTPDLLNTNKVDGSFQKYQRQITFTDKIGIGKLKLKGTWDLHFYQIKQIKRVRLIRQRRWVLCSVLD